MAGKIKGITIEIAGDTQKLNKALEDVNKKGKDLQAELRQVERLLKLDPGNTELVAQKQKLLADAVENSREKLDRLRTAQEQVNEQFRRGEINEEQYRAFQREVVKAEQDLAKFEKQLKETGITAEQVGQKLKDVGDKMTNIGKDLSMKVTAPIVAAGAASFKMAADLQDAMGATEQIYKKAADDVKNWASNLETYYGIAEGEALEYANMMGSLLQNIGGLTEEEAAKQAQTLVELAGDLTAMFGGTTQDAVRALTGALKGNNSMLDNYGIAANEAMIKTKALEMGLVKEGEQLDLAAKQAATLALIMEQTTAAQGQAAREAEGASGSIRALTTELKNLATDVGEVLLPVITPFVQMLGDMVRAFGELSPTTQKVIVAIAGIAAAVGPLLIFVGNLIKAVGTITALFGSLVSGIGALIPAVGGAAGAAGGLGGALAALTGPVGLTIAAIAGLTAGLVVLYNKNDEFRAFVDETWVKIKDKINGAIKAIRDFVEPYIRDMVKFVKGQLEEWKAFWEQNGEQILSMVKRIWDQIRGNIELALGIIKGRFKMAWPIIEGIVKIAWENMKLIVSNATDLIRGIIDIFLAILRGDWGAAWQAVKDTVKNIWGNIETFLKNIDLKEIGKNIIQGFIDGIGSMIDALQQKVKSVADTVTGGLKNMLKIQSPSRVLRQLGEYTGEGFALGLERTIDAVRREVAEMAAAVTGGLSGLSAPRAAGGGVATAASSTINMEGLFAGANFYVRTDEDIRKVAKELFDLQQGAMRRRGL